ncbi:MAG: hypothetical protein GWP05_06425 [Anaerolineaceae bacterium]|nr:hypothetical protein [Anaerolineaceae bacterium]
MFGKLSMATAVGLGFLLPLVLAGRAIAEENDPGGETKQNKKKVDKYLGIDWGDDQKKDDKKEADDPNAASPSREVDLTTVLSGPQAKRLAAIKKKVAKADKLAELAAKTLAGQTKGVKKSMAIRQYDGASAIFKKAMADIEKLARSINDDDTRLTLLREYGDKYKRQACELLCKAGLAAIKTAGNKVDNIKTAVKYFKRARKIDPTYPGIAEGIAAARSAYKDITTRLAEAKNRSSGGGGGDTTPPDRGREDEQQGREDRTQDGREYERDTH